MTLQHVTPTAHADYRWRRAKTAYIVISAAVLILSSIALVVYNNRQICSTDVYLNDDSGISYQDSYRQELNARVRGNNPDVSTACVSAARHGDGISPGVIVLEVGIAIAGYYFLSRLYRYLTPLQNDNSQR